MSYPYLFYKFGGEQDFKRARELEEALKQAGLEPYDDFYDELLEEVRNYGSADYLGSLYAYAVESVRSEAEGMGLKIADSEFCSNGVASSGTIVIAEPDDTDKDRDTLEDFLETLRDFKDKVNPLEDWLDFGVGTSVNDYVSLDEYIEKFEEELDEDEGVEI